MKRGQSSHQGPVVTRPPGQQHWWDMPWDGAMCTAWRTATAGTYPGMIAKAETWTASPQVTIRQLLASPAVLNVVITGARWTAGMGNDWHAVPARYMASPHPPAPPLA